MNTIEQETYFNLGDTLVFSGVGRASDQLYEGEVLHVFSSSIIHPLEDSRAVELMIEYDKQCRFNPVVAGRQSGKRHYLVRVGTELWRPSLTRIIIPSDSPATVEKPAEKPDIEITSEALTHMAMDLSSDDSEWEDA